MVELELEKTYLPKELPADLASWPSKIIVDHCVPIGRVHPTLRIRRKGDEYTATKKLDVAGKGASIHEEHTIVLDQEEYEALIQCPGKGFTKRRYYCKIEGHDAEVDLYEGDLAGLVVIDYEVATEAELDAFVQPACCLADVTDDAQIAGGMLAGKKYSDIQERLEKYGYKPLSLAEAGKEQ